MKKQSFLLSLALVAGLIGAVAFKPATQTSRSGEQWFIFDGGDQNTPANYELYGSSQPSCSGTLNRCAVFVMPDANQPDQPDQTSLDQVSGSNVIKKN